MDKTDLIDIHEYERIKLDRIEEMADEKYANLDYFILNLDDEKKNKKMTFGDWDQEFYDEVGD